MGWFKRDATVGDCTLVTNHLCVITAIFAQEVMRPSDSDVDSLRSVQIAGSSPSYLNTCWVHFTQTGDLVYANSHTQVRASIYSLSGKMFYRQISRSRNREIGCYNGRIALK